MRADVMMVTRITIRLGQNPLSDSRWIAVLNSFLFMPGFISFPCCTFVLQAGLLPEQFLQPFQVSRFDWCHASGLEYGCQLRFAAPKGLGH
jgi:hypothetical protein